MNVGEVAERLGLSAKTIRYYESVGLIRPTRSANGYRSYDDGDYRKLAFLARARGLGFSVAACRELLALYEDRSRASADVKRVAQEHLDEIDAKLAELEAMRRTLSHLVDCCRGDDRPDCPILDELDKAAS